MDHQDSLFKALEAVSENEATPLLRRYWESRLEELRQEHISGANGLATAQEISVVMDHVVEGAYRRVAATSQGTHALVALGGYGRAEMGPRSDVDLLFLFANEKDQDESLITGVLHPLWDLGYDVGHSSRTLTECLKMARQDLKSCTAMMDGRLLAGDAVFFEKFRQQFFKQLPKATFSQLLKWRQARARHSGSVQLLEPNVKESPGGLREIHVLEWALKAQQKTAQLAQVWPRYLSAKDLVTLQAARDFFWRVRHQLHFSVGRKHDVLEHEIKPGVAQSLGYDEADLQAAAEHFMQDYYLHARAVYHLVEMSFNVLVTQNRKPARQMVIQEGVVVANEEIYLPQWERYFIAEPLRLVQIFYLAHNKRLSFSEQAQRAIRASLYLIDDELRASPAARDVFMGLLRRKRNKARTLRTMHDLGVLGAYLPEFGSLTCLVQYDIYHLYTVDEHTLLALENLEAKGQQTAGVLKRTYNEIQRLDLLFLATLLHDVGKSKRDEHIACGIEMVQGLLERLDLPDEDRRYVLFLIEHHQDMVIISQRRDLDDHKMIVEFAGIFAQHDWLRSLYLLSYADLSAVASDAWSEWQDALLREVYFKTQTQLESGLKTLEEQQHAGKLLDEHIKAIKGRWPARKIQAFQQHVRFLPPRYLVGNQRDQIELHLDLIERLGDGLLEVEFVSGQDYTEVLVATRDQRQLLAKMCGVLAVNDTNILRADVHTRDDDLVLDVFQVTDVDGSPLLPAGKQQRIRDQLEVVISGQKKAKELFETYSQPWGRRKKPAIVRPPEVDIENQVSDRYTVIDTNVQDDVGLLYTITHELGELGLDIHMAMVYTVADRAIDAFYVVDAAGQKIVNYEILDTICERLLARLAGK